jgi:hypothetical protein
VKDNNAHLEGQEILARYQALPGWPSKPTLKLIRLQRRKDIARLQARYERALAENRGAQ